MPPTASTTTVRRRPSGERPAACRSRLTNDPLRIAGVDARSAQGRRLRDLIEQITKDLGGPEGLSSAQLSDIRRAAELSAIAEQARAARLQGGGDLAELISLENMADRAMRRLRLRTVNPRNATPSLSEYLAASASPAADDEAAEGEAVVEPPLEAERTGDDPIANAPPAVETAT
jgi:hypothetical protein